MIASVTTACVRQLPPAPTPQTIAPPLPTLAAPPNSYGRLLVDVVEGPTPVKRIRMESRPIDNGRGRTSFRLFESPELLCAASPCVTDMPAGNVVLGFPVLGKPEAMEVELVHVGPDPSVYRRSLSIYEDHTGGLRVLGIVMTAFGGTATMTGTVLLPIGLAKDSDGLTTAGAISLGGGIALLALGIWAMRHDAPTFRPGSSSHFPLSAASR